MSEKDTFDKVFDALLVDALKDVESEDDPNLPEEIDIEFSEKHKAKMKKIFDKEKKKIWRKQMYRNASKVAACFLVLILASGITVMSVSALRVRFLNFVFNTYQTNTEITASEEVKSGTYDTDEVSVGYIPPGFTLKTHRVSDEMVFLSFGNNTDKISIMIYTSDGTASIDTEDSVCEDIVINGMNGLYVENKNGNTLVMYNNETTYMLKGTINREEIVKIAQNLTKK